jgi:hypothetical protein
VTILFGIVVVLLLLMIAGSVWMCHNELVIFQGSMNRLIALQHEALTEHRKPVTLTQAAHGPSGPLRPPE